MDVQIPPVITGNGTSNGTGNGYGQVLSPQRIREAKNEVLLFFVELLMEYKSRKLHDLSCLFGSPNFSAEMKQVVGGSQMGLKRFLLKHPSLFTIKGDTVTMTCYDLEDVFRNGLGVPNGGGTVKSQEEAPRVIVTPEDEAVEFFRSKLLASPLKDDIRQPMPLRSLIGHRSQAPEKIRFIMGRNLPDFIRFVRTHSDVFSYDPASDTVKLVASAQRSPRDCPSPTNSSASSARSMSITSGEFDANDCMDFLSGVLQQKGPLFLDELYGHLNKKYKPDVRQHFAKNPRELGEMIQQKGGNRFLVEGNLVSYHGVPSPTEPSGPYKSPPGSAREGMKLRLAQTLKQVVSDNKAKGTLPEPEVDKTWIPPWTEISKPKQLKGLVSEILDSSASADAVGLAFICDTATPEDGDGVVPESGDSSTTNTLLNYKLSKILLATYDGKVHLVSIAEHPELIRLGGLKELLTSDKIRKVFHDGSKGLAALINQYGLRIVSPFDTQVGYSILDYQQNSPNCADLFLETNRSLTVLDAANGCAPAAARIPNAPGNIGAIDLQLYDAYVNLKIAFPHVYEVLKSRISVRYGTMMRVMLEEQYEEYLNPGRAKLLRKNRRTLHQLDQLQAKLNHYSDNPSETILSEEEIRLQDLIGHAPTQHDSGLFHDTPFFGRKETCDAECQTLISGDIQPLNSGCTQ